MLVFNSLFKIKKNTNPDVNIDIDGINLANVPQHIAIIMDGNGRWAKAQGKVRTFGHQAGAETLKTIVKIADKIGVKVISAYAFSTENWKRPVTEVSFIMELLSRYLTSEIEEFNRNNVQVRFMGSREGLPEVVKQKMDHAVEATKNNTGIILNLAINYGGQAEILQAIQRIAADTEKGLLKVEDIQAETFENYLYTAAGNMQVLIRQQQIEKITDLLIRPGGDNRISNFMLWQIAYAEIWTTDAYWPAFTPEMFLQAIKEYQGRERRFGGLVTK